MIDRMTKYSFVLLSGSEEGFLKQIEALGLVDITRSAKPVDDESNGLMTKISELKKAIDKLEKTDFSKDPDYEKFRNAEHSEIEDPLEACKQNAADLTSLQAELADAHRELEDRKAWGNFDKEKIEALSQKGIKIRFYKVSRKHFNPDWENEYALQVISENKDTVWFVTASDNTEYSFPIDETDAPEGDEAEAKNRILNIQERIISCKGTLLALKQYIPNLKDELAQSSSELQLYLAHVGSGKAAENKITTFEGFAPVEKDAELCKAFDGMDVLYIKETATKSDNPPIKFKSNKFTRMFTVLTDMYGRPVYDEFDPTPFLSFFFTLFFAMCMGDAGYGILLVLIGLLMNKKKSSLGPLVITLGVATFIMGIVLHTFFGIDLSQAAWVPDWLKKCMLKGTVFGYDAQMLFSILIGIIHLSVAFILKAIYSVRRDGFMNSLGTVGWTLLIVGSVVVGGFALLNVIDASTTKIILIVLGIVSAIGIFLLNDIHRNPLANIGMGLYATYNTATGLLGDVLSYLRLYALGLAGGMLGNAFNTLGMSVMGSGVAGIIGAVIILAFGHVLNLAMCCLGAFVHPLRLNFLEFFKNSGYEGTGRTYRPLGEKTE
jgi:V/A-type H+-transporting ATPase subunit I